MKDKKKPEFKAIKPEDRSYSGLYDRMLASCIDIFLSLVILLPFAEAAYSPDPITLSIISEHSRGHISEQEMIERLTHYMIEGGGLAAYISRSLVEFVLAGIAVVLFWIYKGATPGKMLLRMRIIDDKTGGEPTNPQCIIRYIGYIVSSLPFFLGFIWIVFNKKKQGWHDMMAGTVVVSVKKKKKKKNKEDTNET